jgi:type IV secretory pathway VirB3-like protein
LSDLRVVPENRALARRPHLIGLPTGYAALLVMATLFLTLSLKYVGAGLYVLGVGWGFGKLVTHYDPFAFEIVARNLRVPRRLRA